MNAAVKELCEIPGVGKTIAADFYGVGIRRISDLKRKSPEKLYEKLCKKAGFQIDRCMLYVCRCAIYFASHKTHDPRLLRWWNWK